MHVDRLGRGELVAVVGSILLAVCLFLPWYETAPDNPNAVIDGTVSPKSPSSTTWPLTSRRYRNWPSHQSE